MKVLKPEHLGAYPKAAAQLNVLPMFFLELSTRPRKGELTALLWGVAAESGNVDPHDSGLGASRRDDGQPHGAGA